MKLGLLHHQASQLQLQPFGHDSAHMGARLPRKSSGKELCSSQARQILVQNPQLTKALFQAQILLGMVSPPLATAASQPQAASQPPAAQPQQPPQQLPAPVQLPAPGQPVSQHS